jgi:ABC-type nitrate/sulfonate/bicarbonate transport system permease component
LQYEEKSILILIILVIAFFIGYTFCADGVKETENESRNGDQNILQKRRKGRKIALYINELGWYQTVLSN